MLALLLALAVVPAGTRGDTLAPPCLDHPCSNDVIGPHGEPPIYGDEAVRWDTQADGNVVYYIVERNVISATGVETWKTCRYVLWDTTTAPIFGTACALKSRAYKVRVKACNESGVCGRPGDEVRFVPRGVSP